MKRLTKVIAVSLIVAAPALWAADSDNQHGAGGMMMSPEKVQEMQQNMSRMQGMTSQMRQNPGQDHQELMNEHMELMQKQMHMMRGGMMGNRGMMKDEGVMKGEKMMDGQGMQDNSSQGHPAIKPEDRFQFMEKRMDQMQLMMEQMLEHQQQLQGRSK
ncbi:hypothetical protein [Oceanisphaera sp. IT1-181]|uniref:hypothetical protein n=1 Tax=Oceanisphaera sp. IT1-181 TaxID=3081199 RepID=UPI0029CA8EFF|nr:hypothetical protein [Oceanisphaera sp. IT1-181]